MTELAGAVAALGVGVAGGAGGSGRVLGGAARDQPVLAVQLGAVDLAREAGRAVDLAVTRVTSLALGGHAQVILAAIAITALGSARALRHATAAQALQGAVTIVISAARITGPVATAGASSEGNERQQHREKTAPHRVWACVESISDRPSI